MSYCYGRRTKGEIEKLQSHKEYYQSELQTQLKNNATLKHNQRVYHDEQKRLERVIESKNREIQFAEWDTQNLKETVKEQAEEIREMKENHLEALKAKDQVIEDLYTKFLEHEINKQQLKKQSEMKDLIKRYDEIDKEAKLLSAQLMALYKSNRNNN